MDIETKYLGGTITETKQATRNGIEVGIIEGYIATWDADEGGMFGMSEQFVRGAFTESLAEHRERGNRQIRLKEQHGKTIGGFPIETAREDDRGLFAIGEINLEMQQGREVYSLARQRVLTDMSIGFSSIQDKITDHLRLLLKATVWEGSIVDEPMNRAAQLTAVKAVVPFQDFQLASRDRAWDAGAARKRIRDFTGSEDAPSAQYKKAFVVYDREDAESFGAYKLPISDVIDGKLMAVPRGIFAAAGVIQGGRGGVSVSDQDRKGAIRHLERYYAKLDMESPFDAGERQFFGVEEVKGFTIRDLESALAKSGAFSKGASRLLAGQMFEKKKHPNGYSLEDLHRDLIEAREAIT